MKNLERDRRRKKDAIGSQDGGFRTFVTENRAHRWEERHMYTRRWCGCNCLFCVNAEDK